MAIDRVTASNPALSIHDRQLREAPGQAHAQPVPPVAQPPGDAPDFALQSGLPASVGALLEAAEGLSQGPASTAVQTAAVLGARALVDAEPAAMQPNQIFMSRQMVWHNPDTNVMAASWQVMVRTYSEQRRALMDQAEGKHLPASLFMADSSPAALREGRGYPPHTHEEDAWRFAVYAWGAEKLTLRVVARDPGQQGPGHQKRRPRIAVRLELNLPDAGKVVVQLEPADGGVLLEIGAMRNEAMQFMRDMLPQIATVVGNCGLQIVRARLMRDLSPVSAADNHPTRLQIAMLSQSIFKALAEVAVLLSQPRRAET
ncbi:MAG TPA: hypothetical protein VGF27_01550 [Pseudoduganella sp.]